MMINSCIDRSESQKKLIEFKKHTKTEQDDSTIGSVGKKYWRSFLARNSDKLELKKAVKYELERDNFVTHANFEEMYNSIEDLLVNDANIAIKLPKPLWMNEKGEVVSEMESFGMKNSIKITHPDLGITLDEVGGNTNMMDDGHIGGTLHVVSKGSECQIKASKKDKRFTVLGLTCFSGEAIMCVVIIDAKTRDIYAETGVDPNMPHSIHLNDGDELDMLVNNIGPGKMFPGGPTCVYKGKTIPCMVRFNEGGGINGTILKEIFETLDKLEVFDEDRKEGRKPFVLLDGHQSRFDLEFLEYINDPKHEWCFWIGVPYGTALWQVGLPLLDQVKAVRALREEEANVKKEENIKQYKKMIADGAAVLKKHNNSTATIKDWNITDITLLLRTYRRKEDKPIPKKKDALLRLFDEWKNRETTNYNGRVVINLLDADPVEEVQVVAAVPVPEPIADDAFDVKLQAGGEVAM